MHPSRAIRGRHSDILAGRRIVVGVSGSIAAVEVVRVIRELLRHGAEVRAVMSPDATHIVTAEAVRFATGQPVVTALTGDVEHVSLLGPGPDRADLYLVAPATANTISKIAHGIDDTVVTSFASIALGTGVPLLIAPAMHAGLGRNPAVQENLGRLKQWGVGIVQPTSAEGEEKLASPEEIAAAVLHRLASGPWVDRRVVVIGGASHEPIDAVRSLTNESSGETALALATQAYFRGAVVELWLGAASVVVPSFLSAERWRSVDDLVKLARTRAASLKTAAAVWVPAALSDYTVTPEEGKISSREKPEMTLKLRRAPKVLGELRRFAPSPTILVGFKLEAGLKPADLESSARSLAKENGLDWVVANDRVAMGAATVDVLVVPPAGKAHWLHGPKATVAGKLLDDVGRGLSGPAVKPARAA